MKSGNSHLSMSDVSAFHYKQMTYSDLGSSARSSGMIPPANSGGGSRTQ